MPFLDGSILGLTICVQSENMFLHSNLYLQNSEKKKHFRAIQEQQEWRDVTLYAKIQFSDNNIIQWKLLILYYSLAYLHKWQNKCITRFGRK